MTQEEWELLCDGCGKCCLHKIQDEDTGEIAMTDVACEYLDLDSCQCRDYTNRQANVPDCVKLTRTNLPTLKWLPETCAYRLVYQGKDLPKWHHLVCGDHNAVLKAGQSARGHAVSEGEVEDIERRVINWLNSGGNDKIFIKGRSKKDR